MNLDYAIKVLKADIEYMIEIESHDRKAELQLAISILEKSVILDDLFKDAIVYGENAEVSE